MMIIAYYSSVKNNFAFMRLNDDYCECTYNVFPHRIRPVLENLQTRSRLRKKFNEIEKRLRGFGYEEFQRYSNIDEVKLEDFEEFLI